MNKTVKRAACCICCAALATCCALVLCGCSNNKSARSVANGAWRSSDGLSTVSKSISELSNDIAAVRAYVDPVSGELSLVYLDKKGRDLSTFWKGTFDRAELAKQVPLDISKNWADAGISETSVLTAELVGQSSDDGDGDEASDGDGREDAAQRAAETAENDDSPYKYEATFSVSAVEGSAYAFDSLDVTYDGFNDTLSFNLPVGTDYMVEVILNRDYDANAAIEAGENPFSDSPLSSGDVQATTEAADADESWAGGNIVSQSKAIDVLKNNKWDESVRTDAGSGSIDGDNKADGSAANEPDQGNKSAGSGKDAAGSAGDDSKAMEIDGVIVEQS